MASTKKQILISIALMAFAVSVTFLLFLNRPDTQIADPKYQPVSVDVAEVVKENITIEVQAQGTVSPLRQSSLMSEVQGRVIEVSPAFNVGGFVAADEILMRIDPRDYQTSLLRAQAAVESAESALAQEQGRAQVAQREWEKLPAGSQRSQQAKDLYLRKPQLEQAQAQLLAAQADLDTARDNLDRTIIRAPYNALIRAKHSDLGQFVSPGSPLADIFSIESAEIRLPIPQSRLEYLELPGVGGTDQGAPIDLYTDVGGDLKHWKATLHRTEGVFDERSRALYAVARVEDPYGILDPSAEQLRIGTFVNANIQGRELHDIVRLPRYVIRAGNYVWVVDENSRLRNRKVSLLRAGGDIVYVSAGLNEGDRVSLTTLDSSFDTAEVIIHSSTPSNELDLTGAAGTATPEVVQDATAAVAADAGRSDG
ncbi:MAG: efflux RND transporter periplasmic adaptor subunit [Gammaproteobacteria bacterium]|nr:efflux RND transporter periplasmic adaptor subunit [Gammaproteobacteria bacterium]